MGNILTLVFLLNQEIIHLQDFILANKPLRVRYAQKMLKQILKNKSLAKN